MKQLIEAVFEQNMQLHHQKLVVYTWGNVSQIDRASGLVAIKPSGVPYEQMTPEDIVVVDLEGTTVKGSLRPSSDLPTHLVLYKAFENVHAVVHTHSRYATAWAQAGLAIPSLGTTHADYFYGEVPVTRDMTLHEIEGDYEAQTGAVIVEAFQGKNPVHTPAVLVKNHGPFTWGKDAAEAVYHAVVLEEVAAMAYLSRTLCRDVPPAPFALVDKHFGRKHGPDAYYGQK